MYFYRAGGLQISSEIALPGLIEGVAGDSDVTIRCGDVPERLDGAVEGGPNWQFGDQQLLLAVPDIAVFHIIAGRQIVVAPAAEVRREDIAIYLCGTVIGAVLHQRARIVLHASAVLVGNKAVLFCGASGAGKSTTAAALNKRGYALVSDDVCALDIDADGVAWVMPDGRNLKLWNQAVKELDVVAGDAVTRKIEKFYVEPGSVLAKPVPVGALYALREARPPAIAGITKPNVVDAAILLRTNAYRPLLVRCFGQRNDYFSAAVSLANQAGIYLLTRDKDFSQLDSVLDDLERHWAETGLLSEAVS